MTARRLKVLLFSVFVLPVLAFIGDVNAGCKTLTLEDQAGIARDGVRADMCVAKAHACKLDGEREGLSKTDIAHRCWPVADECMEAAGLRDGGGLTQNGISSKDGSHE